MYSSALPDLGEDISEIAITMVFPLRKRKHWVGGVTKGTEEAKLFSHQLKLHFYSKEVEIHLGEVCDRGTRAPSPCSAGPKANLHEPERVWLPASLGTADADRQPRTVEQTEWIKVRPESAAKHPSLHDSPRHQRYRLAGSLCRAVTRQKLLRHVSCQQAKILILNFSMKPIAILFWLWAARVLGQGYGNEMSKQPVYELRLLSCFHASPPAGWHFSDRNSP